MSRKLIAIFTALLLAASLCACNNGNNGDESTTEDNRIEIPSGEDSTTEDTTKGDTEQTTESQTQTPADSFEECNDTVYVLTKDNAANLRISPSMNASAIATSVVNGTELKRVAVSNDGWSKVVYNDETYYIKTSCVVWESMFEGYVAATGTVTLSGNCYVRIAPTSTNDPVGTLAAGDTIEVIAVNETTGWYKINFDGVYYTGEAYVYINADYMEGEVVVETETAGNDDTTAAESLTETPGEE